MPLPSGTRLGPYEILAPIGAGGMGEVYRARDPRIGREVAIKVLPSAFAQDADRLRRFEQEVQAAGSLNHPNILTIYDVGTQDGSPYIVSELLEGETLRERLRSGALPQRKTSEYALGIAHGLAAAHEKGIVHRDLKPENIFITEDGRVKILDFGLAKLIQPEAAAGSNAPTIDAQTDPGSVLGTVGYMSPEQVRGRPADARSDIFALGATLYEMLSGRRAFSGETAGDSMAAILKEDPPPLAQINPNVAPALDRVVYHCLEKNPAERFQSARDLAFNLAALSGTSTPSAVVAAPKARPRVPLLLLAVLGALVLAVVVFWTGERIGERAGAGKSSVPVFRQLTFRRGGILSARFAPDGQTVIYGAAWEGKPVELLATRPPSPESRSLGLPSADVLSISPGGELAVSLGRDFLEWWLARGTLARVPLTGGAPREILENVQEAQWLPDGSRLAVVRNIAGRFRIEWPIGKVIYESAGGISHARLSPKADLVAFIYHPFPPDDAGLISVVDSAGKKRDLTPRYGSAQGLAWSPSGEEIWFTAAEVGVNYAVRAVAPSAGKVRVVFQSPGRLILQDISRDGRALLSRESQRVGLSGLFPGGSAERDLSWLDFSFCADLSADGKTVLISEQGEGAGSQYDVYLRKTDGSPAVKLGEGFGTALSPNGKWVFTILRTSPTQLILLPTGAGEPRPLPRGPIENYEFNGAWLPDSKEVVFDAREPGHGPRLYRQAISGGNPHAISPEGITLSGHAVSPDGMLVAGIDTERRTMICPLAGGDPRPIAGLDPGEIPIRWSSDGRWLYVFRTPEVPIRVKRVEVSTGRTEMWKEIQPADPAGFMPFYFFQITPDGKYYCYTYSRLLADLYLAEGLK